jgi:hypothetical protein
MAGVIHKSPSTAEETHPRSSRHPEMVKTAAPPSSHPASSSSIRWALGAMICAQPASQHRADGPARSRRSGPCKGWMPVLIYVSLTALLIANGDADFCIRMRTRACSHLGKIAARNRAQRGKTGCSH